MVINMVILFISSDRKKYLKKMERKENNSNEAIGYDEITYKNEENRHIKVINKINATIITQRIRIILKNQVCG